MKGKSSQYCLKGESLQASESDNFDRLVDACTERVFRIRLVKGHPGVDWLNAYVK